MTTVIIEDDSVQAKKFVAYTRTLPFAKVKKEKAEPEYNLYESLDRAFADVRLMMDGKKKKKTLDELIQSLGLATHKKSGLEEALEDVANGRITTIHIPQKRKIQ